VNTTTTDPEVIRQSGINFEAAAALIAVAKLSEEQAKAVVRAIAQRKIPQVRISYT
jgi:hypothetical protein